MKEKINTVVVRFDWFWVSVAAIVIATMAFGYSCHGCADCRAPLEKSGVECEK